MPVHYTLDEWMKLNQQSAEMQQGGQQQGQDQIFHPKTDADFDKLPLGSVYLDPDDGKLYRKQNHRKENTDKAYRYTWS